MAIDRDQLREEVVHFFENYGRATDEVLDALLKVLILLCYPTVDGRDS